MGPFRQLDKYCTGCERAPKRVAVPRSVTLLPRPHRAAAEPATARDGSGWEARLPRADTVRDHVADGRDERVHVDDDAAGRHAPRDARAVTGLVAQGAAPRGR
jgi:hypothetical protein